MTYVLCLQREEGKFAMCTNCGNQSSDYDVCDSCKKPLPENVKFYTPNNSNKKARMDHKAMASTVSIE